jgi:hypothetical protein
MKSVYALFENFADADAAFVALQHAGFDPQNVSVIVQDTAAKKRQPTAAATTVARAPSAKRRPQPKPAVGLGHLLRHGRPTHVPEAGAVYAINEPARQLVRVASAQNPIMAAGGLKAALQEAGVTADYAEAYHTGLKNGWLLMTMRVEDERALEAAEIMEQHQGRRAFIFIPE